MNSRMATELGTATLEGVQRYYILASDVPGRRRGD